MTSIRLVTKVSILAVLLVGFAGLPAFAQFLSGIEGTVHDSSGAVVAKAKVSITDVQIGVTRETTTNDAGYFHVESIGASTYKVRIEAGGFKAWEQTGLAFRSAKPAPLAPCWRWERYPPRLLSTQPPLQSIWYRRKPSRSFRKARCRRHRFRAKTSTAWPLSRRA